MVKWRGKEGEVPCGRSNETHLPIRTHCCYVLMNDYRMVNSARNVCDVITNGWWFIWDSGNAMVPRGIRSTGNANTLER